MSDLPLFLRLPTIHTGAPLLSLAFAVPLRICWDTRWTQWREKNLRTSGDDSSMTDLGWKILGGTLTVILLIALILAAPARPPDSGNSYQSSSAHLAMISRQEIAPGLTRQTALDIVGLKAADGRGYFSVADGLTCREVLASWGTPDAYDKDDFGDQVYIYRYGDIADMTTAQGGLRLCFNRDCELDWIRATLFPAWYKRHFPSWTDDQCWAVWSDSLRVGMSPEMVIASWGRPKEVNRTTNSNGIREQWVFFISGKYAYFTNYTLTSWQE